MVLDIIIIAGVAAAMLGWNVHVMRENGVSAELLSPAAHRFRPCGGESACCHHTAVKTTLNVFAY